MATKIFIDAGHGGTDPGALGNGVVEQAVNLNVARELARLLRQGGYEVMEYRTTRVENVLPNKNADLRNRAAMANQWGADYFISIHTNASANPSATGSEAFVYSRPSQAYDLAERMLVGLNEATGLRNRGAFVRPGLYVLRKTSMPSVLIELGFITNPSDASLMNNNPELFARGIYNGIVEYLG